MKQISFFIPLLGTLLLSGCAGTSTEFECNATTSDIPDNSVQPGAGNGEPVTAEVLAQRQAEEAIRRETERRADEIVRKMAENKPDLPDGKTEQAVRDIAGLERDRSAISTNALPVLAGQYGPEYLHHLPATFLLISSRHAVAEDSTMSCGSTSPRPSC